MSTRYLPLFVYGTLKLGSRGFGSSLKAAVTEFAPAYLREASLYIGASYPMAIRSIGGTGIVGQILLVEQRLFEETLEELDEYEGYLGEGDPNNMYTRQVVRVEVFPDENSTWEGPTQDVRAYAYMATPDSFRDHRGELVLSPSGDWENHEEEWEELSPTLEDTQDPNYDERFADDEDEDELDR